MGFDSISSGATSLDCDFPQSAYSYNGKSNGADILLTIQNGYEGKELIICNTGFFMQYSTNNSIPFVRMGVQSNTFTSGSTVCKLICMQNPVNALPIPGDLLWFVSENA